MENLLNRKLRIGISSCKFGIKVRYNTKTHDITEYIAKDRNEFIWTPVCPEIISGLGVFRPTIKLYGGNGFDFWEGTANVKTRIGTIVNEKIKYGSLKSLEILDDAEIDAFIYMDGSPSCGIYKTNLKNKNLGNPPGVFGALLIKKGVFLINSLDLKNPIKWQDLKRRLLIFTWIKEKEINSKETLNDIWDKIKYALPELNKSEVIFIENSIQDILNSKNNIPYLEYTIIKLSIINFLRKPSHR